MIYFIYYSDFFRFFVFLSFWLFVAFVFIDSLSLSRKEDGYACASEGLPPAYQVNKEQDRGVFRGGGGGIVPPEFSPLKSEFK